MQTYREMSKSKDFLDSGEIVVTILFFSLIEKVSLSIYTVCKPDFVSQEMNQKHEERDLFTHAIRKAEFFG